MGLLFKLGKGYALGCLIWFNNQIEGGIYSFDAASKTHGNERI